jgi:hypothetical protein
MASRYAQLVRLMLVRLMLVPILLRLTRPGRLVAAEVARRLLPNVRFGH